MSKYLRPELAFSFVFLVVAVSLFLVSKQGPYVDEIRYLPLISAFSHMTIPTPYDVAAMPGYLIFAAMFAAAFGFELFNVRLSSVFAGLLSVIVAAALARHISGKSYQPHKILQCAFLPILFPFFFLVYPDVLSLLFVLLALLFFFRKGYFVSAAFGLLGFSTRQNNIIWVLFLLALLYMTNTKVPISSFFVKAWPYIAVLAVFLGFLAVNKSFAVGDRLAQPLKPSLMNPFMFLFLWFFINLPLHVYNLRAFIISMSAEPIRSQEEGLAAPMKPCLMSCRQSGQNFRSFYWPLMPIILSYKQAFQLIQVHSCCLGEVWNGRRPLYQNPHFKRTRFNLSDISHNGFLLLAIVIFYGIFQRSFVIDHIWNQMEHSYFIRNILLHFFDGSIWLKTTFFVIMMLGAASLFMTKLEKMRPALIYPFIFIFLAMSWLVEPRYYIIPSVLINMFRKPSRIEPLVTVWYTLLTAAYFYVFLNHMLFW